MRIPLAKYGLCEIFFGLAASLLLALLLAWLLAPVWSLLGLVPLAAVAAFFRDPERTPPSGEEKLVAPADGKVVEIGRVDRAPHLDEPAVKIGIFLSVLNAHVNRSPCRGEVDFLDYKPGRFLDARNPASSAENECNAIGIADPSRGLRVLVRQISGAIARRIVCACALRQRLERGERIGMIKFGSRTEVYIPARIPFRVTIQVGDRVKAGTSVIGVLE